MKDKGSHTFRYRSIYTHNKNDDTNNNDNIIVGNGNGTSSSFLLRMQNQRERIIQRQKRERQFSSKIQVWIIIFIVGILCILYLFEEGTKYQYQDQRNLDHYSDKAAVVKNENGNDVNVNDARDVVDDKRARSGKPGKNRQPINKQSNESSSIRGAVHRQDKPGQGVEPGREAEQSFPKGYESDNNKTGHSNIPGHKHAIPPILIFTYHTNLLTTPESDLADDEDVALSKNVKEIISLHNPNSSQVRFLNDDDCLKSIQYALGKDTKLTTYFTNESHGMYKADICRGAALYESGGLYFDIDIEARMTLWNVIATQTEFVTTFVHKDSNHLGGFFQAFIGVTPHHAIMKRYLELFVRYYEGELKVNGPLGVYFLRMAYDDIIGKDNTKNNDSTIDLWQEIRYTPELFPDVQRKWGARRACQMLVVAKAMDIEGFKREQMVPLFSHANGSRMCGGKDTKKNGKIKR